MFLIGKKSHRTVINDLKGYTDYEVLCPKLQTVMKEEEIPIYKVNNINNNDVKVILKQYKIDLIVLGDNRILKADIFSIPRLGTINIHPGYLPDVRGNTPYIWAAYHNLKQGVTAHLIDNGIDTGPILYRRGLTIQYIRSYAELLATIHILCGEVAVEAIRGYVSGKIIPKPQEDYPLSFSMPTFSFASSDIKTQVIRKIKSY